MCRQVGVSFFFPEDGERGNGATTYELARTICSGCTVRAECLEWALRHELYGMWGGKSPFERQQIRKKRKINLREILVKDYV